MVALPTEATPPALVCHRQKKIEKDIHALVICAHASPLPENRWAFRNMFHPPGVHSPSPNATGGSNGKANETPDLAAKPGARNWAKSGAALRREALPLFRF